MMVIREVLLMGSQATRKASDSLTKHKVQKRTAQGLMTQLDLSFVKDPT